MRFLCNKANQGEIPGFSELFHDFLYAFYYTVLFMCYSENQFGNNLTTFIALYEKITYYGKKDSIFTI